MYQLSFVAGAGDFDFDGRFRGAICLDRAKDVRWRFFSEHGYPVEALRRQHLLPLVLKEKIDFQRDIEPLDEFRVSLALAGLAADGTRFMTRCELMRSDGKAAARVTSTCGWLDPGQQKFVIPPAALIAALKELPMSADYQTLPGTL